ncbi:MAG: hypothetical protein P4M14_04735 [Gammaproteobacteria bacterium]|nr:hypothetical protein [Gammaproteobacteria bacterium]
MDVNLSDVITVILVCLVSWIVLRLFIQNEKRIVLMVILIAGVFLATQKYFIPLYEADTYETSLRRSDSVIDLMAKKSPEKFNRYIEKVKQSLLHHADKNKTFYYTNEYINSVFSESIPYASNKSLYVFFQNELEIDKKLFLVDPHLVLYIEFIDQFKTKTDPGTILSVTGDRLIENSARLKEAVIQSALESPEPPLTNVENNRAAQSVDAISAKLTEVYGKETLLNFNRAEDPTIDQKKTAEAIMRFYSEILARGEDEAGLIFRYLAYQMVKNKS